MKIIPLPTSYNSHQITFEYETNGHFKAEVVEHDDSFHFNFVFEPLDKLTQKSFSSVLVPDYLDKPKGYVIQIDDQIVAYLVVNHEDYNNRLRVTELLVNKEYRYQGLGKRLMQVAETYAQEIRARSIILETQSCNIPAIKFYRSCGYKFVGCDVNSYTNYDITDKEVRLEMAKLIKQPD
jgi:ribosomal protein S18 acetylase RimI-like enzyme